MPNTKYKETEEDLRIKYQSCFVGWKGNNTANIGKLDIKRIEDSKYISIFSIREIISYDNTIYAILEDKHSNVYKTKWSKIKKELVLSFPELGCINTNISVVYASRCLKMSSPYKYRKGLTQDSLVCFNPTRLEGNKLGYPNLKLKNATRFNQYDLVENMYFKENFSSAEALDSILLNKRLGAAFSRDYYYTLNLCNNSISLWRCNDIIGVLNKNNMLINLSTDIFNNDLMELGVPFKK